MIGVAVAATLAVRVASAEVALFCVTEYRAMRPGAGLGFDTLRVDDAGHGQLSQRVDNKVREVREGVVTGGETFRKLASALVEACAQGTAPERAIVEMPRERTEIYVREEGGAEHFWLGPAGKVTLDVRTALARFRETLARAPVTPAPAARVWLSALRLDAGRSAEERSRSTLRRMPARDAGTAAPALQAALARPFWLVPIGDAVEVRPLFPGKADAAPGSVPLEVDGRVYLLRAAVATP